MDEQRITKLLTDVAAIKDKLEELELRIISNEELNDIRDKNNSEIFDVIMTQMGDLYDRVFPMLYKVFPGQVDFENKLEKILNDRKPPKA